MPDITEVKTPDESLELKEIPPYKKLTREEAVVANDFLKENSPSVHEKFTSYFQKIYPTATDVCVSPRAVVWADMPGWPYGTPTVAFFGSIEKDNEKTEIQDDVSLNVFNNSEDPITSEEREKIDEAIEMVSKDYRGGA